ncbi:hypothetical protein Tco_0438336 [Tanacetum coccineum]
MSRTNSQAEIVSKEQLVPRANRLVIKKNNQGVASDSHITDTMLRFVVEILRHHKLYKSVSLIATIPIIYLHQFWTTINHNKNNHTFTFELDTQTFTLTPGLLRTVLQMPHPDRNNTYAKPPLEIQILKFIKTLDVLQEKTQAGTQLDFQYFRYYGVSFTSANLDFASLLWDEFEWQAVERSSRPSKMSKLLYTRFTKLIIDYILSHNKSIPRRSYSKLHSSQDDQPITKLLSITNGDYKFGMEVPDAMISDAIKKKAGYTYYMAKKVESEKAKIVDEPEKQHKDAMPRKTRSLTIAEEAVVGELTNSISIQELRTQQRRRSQLTIDSQLDDIVADIYAEWGQKLKGPAVDDPVVQSLLDLQKGSKASRLESLKQKNQAVAGEGSSAARNKYYDSSNNNSDATLYSSSSNESEESANETDDADESDMDLSDDNPNRDDDAARKINFKKAVAQKFREYDQKLEALTNFNVFEAFEKAVQAKVLTEIKKLLPTHIPSAIANYVRPRLNTSVLEVMKTKQINLFTQSSTSTDGLSEMDLKSHDNQDPPNNREGENKKKRQKDVGEPSSRSSRRNKSPVVIVQDD